MPFEIRKEQSHNKTIRMPETMILELEKLAHEKDISFNNLVLQCCAYALKNISTTDDSNAQQL